MIIPRVSSALIAFGIRAILTECGLVESNQQGREIYYQIKMEKMKKFDLWLGQILKIWEDRFNNLDAYLEKIQKNKR